MAYEPPKVTELGTVQDMTLDVTINKSGKGSDAFSATLQQLGQQSTGSIVHITVH